MIWTVDHTLSHTIPLNKLGHRSYLCTTIKNKTKSVVSKKEIILGTYKLSHTPSVVQAEGGKGTSSLGFQSEMNLH